MKKVLSLALVICLLLSFCAFPAFAEEAETEESGKKSGLFTYELKGNGNAVITDFDWEANGGEDIYVPNLIDGYTVTEIGSYAFSDDIDIPKNT